MSTSVERAQFVTAARASAATIRSRRRLTAIAVGAVVLLAILYIFGVRTVWGQRLDAAAVNGRHVLSLRDYHVAARLHTSIDVASLALLGTAIMLVALVRGRVRLAVGAATVIVGSLATTEALKRILDRPALGVVDVMRGTPSFPSGHTTIAMALGVSATLVAPRRWRSTIAALGAVFAAAIGCSVVATGSHRPSDAIGAVLVVTGWFAVVAAVLLRSDSHPRSRRAIRRLSPWLALGGIAFLVAAFFAAVVSVVAIHYGRLNVVGFGRAFVGACSAIVGSALTCTAALLVTLQDSRLDGPARPVAARPQANRVPSSTRA